MTVRIEPEEELEQPDVEPVCRRDENEAERDARVEDERECLVACRPAARSEPLDGERARHREGERRQHRGDIEQISGRDAGEGDVAEAVADEGLLPLDEEEPDRRREDADDGADGEGDAQRTRGRASGQ